MVVIGLELNLLLKYEIKAPATVNVNETREPWGSISFRMAVVAHSLK